MKFVRKVFLKKQGFLKKKQRMCFKLKLFSKLSQGSRTAHFSISLFP